MKIPENASEGEIIRAFQKMMNARGASEYLATLDGSEKLTIHEMLAEVETAGVRGVRLPRMATEHEIRVAFIETRSYILSENRMQEGRTEFEMSNSLPIVELDNEMLEVHDLLKLGE
jgi:hypothetical protein